MSDLKDALLAIPVGKAPAAKPKGDMTTRQLVFSETTATATIPGPRGTVDESDVAELIRSRGLDPDEWAVKKVSISEWGQADAPMDSLRAELVRKGGAEAEREPIDHLVDRIIDDPGRPEPGFGLAGSRAGMIVALGDMQFGKIDGDGVEGTLRRVIDCIDEAALRLSDYRRLFDIEHVHLAWLGDHVEGFNSQGGANVWRTQLTLSEQIRLTRRVMLHAVRSFAPLVDRLTVAAVPGNHGETVRFAGKGITRYADSHDTEALVAVGEALEMNLSAYSHVSIYVPQGDEMTVTVDVEGTIVGHVHGHQFRPGKHFEWWEGQAFGKSPLADVDLMLAGHLHHELVDTRGDRTWVQVPSMESESTWWRHSKGVKGNPGLMVLITKDGKTPIKELVQSSGRENA